MKQAQKPYREAIRLPERKPSTVCKNPSLPDRIKLAVQEGRKTREEIMAEINKTTKTSWEDLGLALAYLAFEAREIEIIRKYEKREFHLAA